MIVLTRPPRDIVDLLTRDLAQQAPTGFFGLAGLPTPTSPVRFEDISVIMPELQADKVMVADEGDRATFPWSISLGRAPLQSQFQFPTVRIWEEEEQIRSQYPELAPLLLVTADEPTEETLWEVKELIDGLEEPEEKRENLYRLAATLGMHYFEEALVRAVFGQGREEIRDMGAIDRLLEKYQEGINEGISQGISQGVRQVVLQLLSDKFGQLPETVAARVQQTDAAWCQHLILPIARARSLDELNFS